MKIIVLDFKCVHILRIFVSKSFTLQKYSHEIFYRLIEMQRQFVFVMYTSIKKCYFSQLHTRILWYQHICFMELSNAIFYQNYVLVPHKINNVTLSFCVCLLCLSTLSNLNLPETYIVAFEVEHNIYMQQNTWCPQQKLHNLKLYSKCSQTPA